MSIKSGKTAAERQMAASGKGKQKNEEILRELEDQLYSSITKEEKTAIHNYIGTGASGYETVNGELRDAQGKLGYINNTPIRKQIRAIDSGIDKAPELLTEVITYRGISEMSFVFDKPLVVGQDIASFGYSSTTPNKKIAERFAGKEDSLLIKYKLPVGHKGAAVIAAPTKSTGKKGKTEIESEILLGRYSSGSPTKNRFTITEISGNTITVVPSSSTSNNLTVNLMLEVLGGPGSGNFGHQGRPGKIGGSAGGNSASTMDLKDKKELLQELKTTAPKDQRGKYVSRAVEKASKTSPTALIKDSNNLIIAAGNYKIEKDSLNVDVLGSFGKGGGTALIAKLSQISEKEGKGGAISLTPLRDPNTINFYIKTGFDAHPTQSGKFLLTKEMAKEMGYIE